MHIVKALIGALITVLVIGLGTARTAEAKPEFYQRIPQGYEQGCNLCHTLPPKLTEFGQEFKAAGFSFEELEKRRAGTVTPPPVPAPSGSGVPVASEGSPEQKAAVLNLRLPEQSVRGEVLQIMAELKDGSGNALPSMPITASILGDFFGEREMVIAEATTDQNGQALIKFSPKQHGDVEIKAAFPGNKEYKAASASKPITLLDKGPLYKSDWRLLVPFMTPWIILLLVVLIWGCYYIVLRNIRLIRLEGQVPSSVGVLKRKEVSQHK